ncbi:MAG: GIY-YIG nuclease family protein [Spirochaetaceae bacterium]|nr:GIY-YIG nuclease family protein [Spirochaetaceae bacterium]
METGLLYVVYNEWICDPNSGKMPYKIGITSGTVESRYYGLGLKMPGDFICEFAYEFSQNSLKDIEVNLQELFQKDRINGEWFLINDTQLFAIRAVCEKKGGKLVTEKIEHEIESETKNTIKKKADGNKNIKDHTQYKFKDTYFGKGRLVLAVIDDFVKNNAQYSYNELEKIFNKEIQGSVGVIGKYEVVLEKYKNIKHKRHFLNDAVMLNNGEKIVVSTEWGTGNINKFIEKAKELGFIIE